MVMNKPIIKLIPETYRDKLIVTFRFEYNKDLISKIKKIEGITWSQSKRTWYIPKENFNLHQVFENLKAVTYLDYSTLMQEKPDKPKPISPKPQLKPDVKIPEAYINLLIQKRYSLNTQKIYLSYFSDFMRHFNHSKLERVSKEEINTYILMLIKTHNISSSQQNQRINAIKFYYEKVLGNPKTTYDIERPRKEHKLPEVLSKEDIQKMLSNTKNLKHKAIIALTYSCELRRSEVINLKTEEIDSKQMLILIKGAKGKKDRYVQLSPKVLTLLREYYKFYNPKTHLFEGQNNDKYSTTSVIKIVKEAANKSGIKTRVYPHILRHSFATHQLEQGVDIRYIQEWLSHSSSKTTERYTHVSENNFKNFKNPIEDFDI